MLCDTCRKQHATYEHTFMKGTQSIKVHLCPGCYSSTNAEQRIAKIKASKDHATKGAALDEFFQAIGKKV